MAQHSDTEIRERLFKTIRKQRDGMLGLIGSEVQHPQPMTTLIDDDQETPFYFLTRDDTDLAQAVARGDSQGLYVFQDKGGDLWASVVGRLTISTDRSVIDRFWNPVVAAWYPDGKDDPHIRVLTFEPDDAQVWYQPEGPVRFGWAIAKANATKTMPDVGDRAELKL